MFSIFSLSSILQNYKMFDFICFAWKKTVACLEMYRLKLQLALSLSDCQAATADCQSMRCWGSCTDAQPSLYRKINREAHSTKYKQVFKKYRDLISGTKSNNKNTHVVIRVMEDRVKFCRSGRFNNLCLANTRQEWMKNYQP